MQVLPAHPVHVAFLSADNVCWFVQLVQWPLYGMVLGHAWTRKKLGLAAIVVLLVHLAAWAGAAALGGYPPDQSPHNSC